VSFKDHTEWAKYWGGQLNDLFSVPRHRYHCPGCTPHSLSFSVEKPSDWLEMQRHVERDHGLNDLELVTDGN